MRSESSFEVRIVRRGIGVRIADAVCRGGCACTGAALALRGDAVQAQESAAARMLAQLDSRILKDIGLEPHHGSALAERVHEHRRRELLRTLAGRLGH